MLRLYEQNASDQEQGLRLSGDYRYFCRLFEDMITEGLCRLRRNELNTTDALSCRGCSKDIIMQSRIGRRRKSSVA